MKNKKILPCIMILMSCIGCFLGCGSKKKEVSLMDSVVKIEVDEKKYLTGDLGFAEDCTYTFKGEGIAIYNGILRGMVSGTSAKVYVDDKDGNSLGYFEVEVIKDTYQGYGAVETEEGWYEPIEVEPVEGISTDFSMGMDISTIQNVLEGGGKFYNSEGNRESIYKLLKDNGFTYIRLRLWNEPYQYDADGNKLSYGGGMCDVDTIKEIAVDAKGLGFKLLLNFHYSDFWADPTYQVIPKMWENIETSEEMAKAVYDYTYETVTAFCAAGAKPDMVQIGNEITTGMFLQKGGEDDGTFDNVGYAKYISARTNASNNVRAPYIRGNEESNLVLYVKTGAQAVKAVDDSILIMIQLAKEMAAVDFMKGFYHTFDSVPFDVIGLSYYPRWHGSTERLNTALTALAEEFPEKKVAVVEVSYAYTYEYTKNASNQFNKDFAAANYDVSVQGQANLYRDVIAAVAGVGDAGFGVFVWEGAWLPVEGAGWAAYNTKSSWSNQAFFGYGGKELPSIEVFNRAAGIE